MALDAAVDELAERAGVVNVAIEGQLLLGALKPGRRLLWRWLFWPFERATQALREMMDSDAGPPIMVNYAGTPLVECRTMRERTEKLVHGSRRFVQWYGLSDEGLEAAGYFPFFSIRTHLETSAEYGRSR